MAWTDGRSSDPARRWRRGMRAVATMVSVAVVATVVALVPADAVLAEEPTDTVVAGPVDNPQYFWGGYQSPSAPTPLDQLVMSVYASQVEAAPDGSVWVGDYREIVRVSPNRQTFRRVVGIPDDSGYSDPAGGTPFQQVGKVAADVPVRLTYEQGIRFDIDADGHLVFTDGDGIFRIGAQGTVDLVAGTGKARDDGDGGSATAASVHRPHQLTIGPNGALWFLTGSGTYQEGNAFGWGATRLRRIDPDGTISTVAGTGTAGRGGDSGAPSEAAIAASHFAVGDDGDIALLGVEQDVETGVRIDHIRLVDQATGTIATAWSGDPFCSPKGRIELAANVVSYVGEPPGSSELSTCTVDLATGAVQVTALDGLASYAVISNVATAADGAQWFVRSDEEPDRSGLIRLGDETPTPEADLEVHVADPGDIVLYSQMTVMVDVTNHGPDPAEQAVLRFSSTGTASPVNGLMGCTGSAGQQTCEIGAIPAGDTRRLFFKVDPTRPGAGTLEANVTSVTGDPSRANNTSTRAFRFELPEGTGEDTPGVFTVSGLERSTSRWIPLLWRPDAPATPLLPNLDASASVFEPDLSPDATKVVGRYRVTGVGDRVAVFDRSASTPSVVIPLDGASLGSRPSWSPDGSRFSYLVQRGTAVETWVANADGSERRKLATGVTGVTWSGSADLLLGLRQDVAAGRPTIVTIDVRDGTVTTVASAAFKASAPNKVYVGLSAAQPGQFVAFERSSPTGGVTLRRYTLGTQAIGTDTRIVAGPGAVASDGTVLTTKISSSSTRMGLIREGWAASSFPSPPQADALDHVVNWSPNAASTSGGAWTDEDGDGTIVVVVDPPPTGEQPDPGCNPAPGDCTLDEAIETTNEIDPSPTVVIDLPDGEVIEPTGPLPTITRPVTIIGTGDPTTISDDRGTHGEVGDGISDGCNRSLTLLDGRGVGGSGLRISTESATGRPTRIHGLAIMGFDGDGVRIVDSGPVRVQCSALLHNGGAGMTVANTHDVTAIGDVTISANRGDGIRVTGDSRRVRTWAGSNYGNGGLAIDLADDGPTANDANDADTGPNGRVNHPDLLRIIDDPSSNDPSRQIAFVRPNTNSTMGPVRVDVYTGACDRFRTGGLVQWSGGGLLRQSNVVDPVSGQAMYRLPIVSTPGAPHFATNSTRAGTSETSRCSTVSSTPTIDATPGTSVTPYDSIPGPGGLGAGGGSGPNGLYGEDLDDGPNGQGSEDHPWQGGEGTGGTRTPSPPTTDGGGTFGTTTPPTDSGPAGVDAMDGEHYVISTLEGTTTTHFAPALLTVVHGGVLPYRAVRLPGGTMPSSAWSMTENGAITMDARTLAAGSYSGAFKVIDSQGTDLGPRDIVFVVEPKPPAQEMRQIARPDRWEVKPNVIISSLRGNGVLGNDHWPTTTKRGDVELVGPKPAWLLEISAAHGTYKVDTRGLAEGQYTFQYRLKATAALPASNVATATLVVDDRNTCPAAANDRWEVPSGTILEVPLSDGVLANDVDPEGDAMTTELVGGSFENPGITFNKDGSLTYDARNVSPGSYREFSYWAVDASKSKCAPATVRLDVIANDGPTTNENFYEIGTGKTMTVVARGVLGNDIDPDGPEDFTAQIVHNISGLSLKSDGGFTYKAPKTPGLYIATYTATDSQGGVSAPTEIKFRVTEGGPSYSNTRPVARADDYYRVHADQMLVVGEDGSVLRNDTDAEGHDLFAEPVSGARSRIPLTREGTFVFKPTMADIGKTITLNYVAVEKGYASAESLPAKVSVKVEPPRERCQSMSWRLTTDRLDDGQLDDHMMTSEREVGWCSTLQNITRVGVLDDGTWVGGDQVNAATTSARADADGDESFSIFTLLAGVPFLGLKVRANDKDQIGLTFGAKSSTVTFGAAYEMCMSPLEVMMSIAPWLGNVMRLFKAAKLTDWALSLVSMITPYALEWLDRALGVIDFIADKIGAVMGLLSLDDEVEDAAPPGDMDAVRSDGLLSELFRSGIGLALASTVRVLMPNGTEASIPALTYLKDVLTKDPDKRAELVDAATCVTPRIGTMSEPTSSYVPIIVRATGGNKPTVTVAPFSGVTVFSAGFVPALAQSAHNLDLATNGTLGVEWNIEPGDPVSSEVFVGCDLTRSRPSQTNPPPQTVPGLAPRSC